MCNRQLAGGAPLDDLALIVAVAYAVGGALWIANLAIRLSATPWAADALVAMGAIPPAYAPWRFVVLGAFLVKGAG